MTKVAQMLQKFVKSCKVAKSWQTSPQCARARRADIVQLQLQRGRQLQIRRDDLTQLQLQRNADYKFGESEDSDDELEFNSEASVSKDNEVEDEEEVLVKEELVEVDAKI